MKLFSSPLSGASDAGLVDRAIAGDTHAFGELVGRYHRLAGAVTFGILGDADERDDAVQEGFVRAWHDLSKLKEPSAFKSWLCGIMRHCALTLLRRRAPGRANEESLHQEVLVGAETLPGEQLALDEEAALLARLVQALPASYREPLILFYWEDQSVDKVADLLGLSPDAVKQRLARGREFLRERVQSALGVALERRRPDRRVVAAVLAALPLSHASAQAAPSPAWRGWVWPAAIFASAVAGFIAGQAGGGETPRMTAGRLPASSLIGPRLPEGRSDAPIAAAKGTASKVELSEELIAALRDEEPSSSFRRCSAVVAQWPADDFAGAVQILREHASEGQIAWAAPLFAVLWSERAPQQVLAAFEQDGGSNTAQAITQAMAIWMKTNPPAAAAWLGDRLTNDQPPCLTDAWLAGVAAIDGELAGRWRGTLSPVGLAPADQANDE